MNAPRTIDDYLDALLGELQIEPAQTRRVLAETEAHLRESAGALGAEGIMQGDAEFEAMRRFGTPSEVAARFNHGRAPLLPGLALPFLSLATAGLLAIGASGVLALALGWQFGHGFIAHDAPGVQYTAERCRDFLRFHPESVDCSAAANAHLYDEVVGYRLDAGVLGVLCLGALAVIWRRKPLWRRRNPLPEGVTPAVGMALFGVAAAGLLLIGGMPAAFGRTLDGAGEYLSAGLVAALAAVAYGVAFTRVLRRASA